MRRLGAIAVVAVAAGLPCARPAAAQDGRHAVDAVTDAVRDGAVYRAADDRFLVVCTHNTSGPSRFWIQVQTDAHLGRHGTRRLTYREGDEPPATPSWEYRPREAAPVWPLEDEHLAQRILKGDAMRLALRLTAFDGEVRDVRAPIDDQARELMSKTLAACQVPAA